MPLLLILLEFLVRSTERGTVTSIGTKRTFHYVQNLPLPDISGQKKYRYRELWIFYFHVHDLRTGETGFYSYYEDEGRTVLTSLLPPCQILPLIIPQTETDAYLYFQAVTVKN